ncbi:hypothetical protein DL765_000621 [Monosporascus sp. GIB2]|nr:hypothetical protein DL765_000621 [Monosporascus sp. GIB2]
MRRTTSVTSATAPIPRQNRKNQAVTPGDDGGEKCPPSSCCRVSRELVFDCAAARDAREGRCEVGRGPYGENVHMKMSSSSLSKGLESVWDIGSGCGKCHAEDGDTDKGGEEVNAAAAGAKQESGDNKEQESRGKDEAEGWEPFCDADDEARPWRKGTTTNAEVTLARDKMFVFLKDATKVLGRERCGEEYNNGRPHDTKIQTAG